MASLPSVGRQAASITPGLRPIRVLPILDTYVLRELVGPFVFALAAFLLFWFVNIFFLAADYIINAHAPFFLLLRFLVFRIPQSTPYAFPFACLFATLLAFGRLAHDNEITALRTSGVRFSRIARIPVIAGLAMFALSYYINDRITPTAVDLSTRTFYQIVYHTATLPIEPQFFRKDDSTGRVFYVADVAADQRTMMGVMIFEPARLSPFRRVLTAKEAIVEGQALRLKAATIIQFKPDGLVDFESTGNDVMVGLPLGENATQFLSSSNTDVYTLDSKHLKSQIETMQATGQGGTALGLLKITLAQKLAFPFASFIAVLLAVPLAVAFGRRGRTLGIALSIVLLFIYFLMMSAFVAIGRNGAINPYLAAWIPNIVMGLAGAYLFYREER